MHICCYIITALAVIFVLWLLLKAYFKFVGDCDIQLEKNAPQNIIYCVKNNEFYIKAVCSFINKSAKQQGLIIDCAARVHPYGFDYENAGISVAVNNISSPRADGYWEAYLLKPNKSVDFELIIKCPLRGEFNVGAPHVVPLQEKLKNLEIDFLYKFYCRTPLIYKREIIKLNLEKAKEEEFELFDMNSREPIYAFPTTRDNNIILVKTHLLTEKDDIFNVIEKYVKEKAASGDIVCIAETALAIMQGRFKYIEDINLSFWANILNKFFNYDSSMSSVYAMQMAIDEVGAPRMVFAVVLGTLGKIIGRHGDVYRIAGRAVATIDDCAGTLPPYDKCVVMGPKLSQKVVDEIKTKTGFNAAVVDANDLGKVDVLAISDEKYKNLVMEKLKKNPQGNASEQTPIVIVRGKW